MRLICLALTFSCLQTAFAAKSPASDSFDNGTDVIREINLARQNPALYATYLEELRSHYDGKFLRRGLVRIRTKEGVRAVDEAIRFLRSRLPLQPLIVSPGMCKGAADHCTDQARGCLGHRGVDRSGPSQRMSRYGMWSTAWAENISYGKSTARDIVVQLIVDDGLPGRKHRKNIFNPAFNYAGAAIGPHAIFGTMCNSDFAATYIERDSATLARNY
jgi:uncharacterized protein YkwD